MMGFVWNVLLSFDNDELWEDGEDEPTETCDPLERINAWLSYGKLVSLIDPTYEDDAGAGMDANLYGGGFKRLEIEAFIEVVKTRTGRCDPKSNCGSKEASTDWEVKPSHSSNLAGGRRRQHANGE